MQALMQVLAYYQSLANREVTFLKSNADGKIKTSFEIRGVRAMQR
jgi:hypothetical protein